MGTIAITGSAGGLGSAARARLEAGGHRVIGVDVRDAEVIADLSTPDGRAEMVIGVDTASGGVLDGLVAGAGVSGAPSRLVAAINYFGAVATLDGLRPLLAKGERASAVAISSNSASTQEDVPNGLTEAFLAGDESAALDLAEATNTYAVYPASKLALARWVRRHATTYEWVGSGIRLNSIAPGLIETPMTADGIDFVLSLGDAFPIPMQRAGRADEIGALLAFLLGPDAGFFCGSHIICDGGTDAKVRAEHWPSPRP